MKKKSKPRIDPKACNVPNICFSYMKPSDDRWSKMKRQRLTRGFDDSETWSLDVTIAKFIVPRLERFIEIYKDFVNDTEAQLLPKMEAALEAFKIIKNDVPIFDKETNEKVHKALHDFADIFLALWW